MKALITEYVKDHTTEETLRWISDNCDKLNAEIADHITNKNMELLCYSLNKMAIIKMMAKALADKVCGPKSKVL